MVLHCEYMTSSAQLRLQLHFLDATYLSLFEYFGIGDRIKPDEDHTKMVLKIQSKLGEDFSTLLSKANNFPHNVLWMMWINIEILVTVTKPWWSRYNMNEIWIPFFCA